MPSETRLVPVLEKEKYTMSPEYLCQKVRRCPKDGRADVKELSVAIAVAV